MRPEAEKLKAKLQEWRNWMNGEDAHSIMRQIFQMIGDDAVYRIIGECRRLAPPADGGEDVVQLNGTIHTFIDKSHFRLQSLAIRRLMDRGDKGRGKGSVSLVRLLNDIKDNARLGLVTRGAFFEAKGLACDYAAAKEAAECDRKRALQEALAKGKKTLFYRVDTRLENAWQQPADLHADFDRFSKTTPTTRSESDSLDPELIDFLRGKLNVCNKVVSFVDKLVAHAADPQSLSALSDEAKTLSLKKIEECHKAICGVAYFVSFHLLRDTLPEFLFSTQYDKFAHMEKPWIRKTDIDQLDQVWCQFRDETSKWRQIELPEEWQLASEKKRQEPNKEA